MLKEVQFEVTEELFEEELEPTEEELYEEELEPTEEELSIDFLATNANDSLQLYLKEIGKYKLLTKDEEINLARQIVDGNIEAKKKLIKANLRLVVWVALKYMYLGTPILDRIQDGNIGLMRAVEKFDLSKNTKFSTYAVFFIKRTIKRNSDKTERNIIIPAHQIELQERYNRIWSNYVKTNNFPPSREYIIEKLGIDEKKYKELIALNRFNTYSLNEKIGEEDDELQCLIPDEKTKYMNWSLNIDEEIYLFKIKELLNNNLYYYIIYYRIFADVTKTQKEIGDELGVTSERIRQIEKRVLEKLEKKINFLTDYKKSGNDKDILKKIHNMRFVPLSCNQIVCLYWMQENNILNAYEYNILYYLHFSKYKNSIESIAKKMGKTIEEVEEIERNALAKMEECMSDEVLSPVKKDLLARYGNTKNVMNLDITPKTNISDYRRIEDFFSKMTLKNIVNQWSSYFYSLSDNYKKLLYLYFNETTNEVSLVEIEEAEREINLQLMEVVKSEFLPFSFDMITKEDAIRLLTNENIILSLSVKETLKSYFQISTRSLFSDKNRLLVLRILLPIYRELMKQNELENDSTVMSEVRKKL